MAIQECQKILFNAHYTPILFFKCGLPLFPLTPSIIGTHSIDHKSRVQQAMELGFVTGEFIKEQF